MKQPSGVCTVTIFENLAASNWQLAVSQIWSSGLRSFGSRLHRSLTMTVGSAAVIAPRSFRSLRPSADCVWDWVWDWDWVTLGTRLDHPSVSHASRLGDPWVEWNKWFCLQQEMEKAGWGCAERAYRRHRNRKTFPQQPAICNLLCAKVNSVTLLS